MFTSLAGVGGGVWSAGVAKKEVCCSNQSLCRGVPDADELREGGEEWARADTFLAGDLHSTGQSTKYSVRTAQKRGPHPTKGEETDGGASPEQALGMAAEQRERSATCIFLPNARCTAPQRCRPTSLQVSRPVCLHREIPQPVRHQCLGACNNAEPYQPTLSAQMRWRSVIGGVLIVRLYKQIARRQSTGSTVRVSVEGPGRETQQDDLCSSALESLMEDRAMELEMVSTCCCCCCPAGSCRGQINGDRQAFTAKALDVYGFNSLVTFSLELGYSKVNTAFLACQGMKQPLPPSPLRIPKSTQRLEDVNYKCPSPLCFTCTYVVNKQPVAVA
ncbi:hypothetical protein B0T13DRAFT_498497 [Neurospora crassa]|nr:hypothetical protein B0T13DRAFT_498721 [Neurospora crassa]KAK3485701.1 hypothetical protein B0T13DRAFT_498497 [Neurospora crassa]